ncbi:MAG: adenylate/guanylate cyclase domain-containing protein [Holosporales bacterium]|jgi:adenylate cyclase|nr:adenylate/guanylate cyclase domain-containing protein [Holosporales bacterium]
MKIAHNRRLCVDVLIAFSLLIGITIVSEVLYSTKENVNAVLKFEKNYFSKKLATTVTSRIDAYFNELETVISVLSRYYNNERGDQIEKFNDALLEGIKRIQHIMSLYITLSDGTFIQARTTDGITHFRNDDKTKLPSYVKYIIRKVQHEPEGEGLTETWTYLSEDSELTTSEVAETPTNDFSKRDWYVKAELNKALTWSDEYIFASTLVPGITLSNPLGYNTDGNAVGVIGVDFAFSYIEPLLQSVKVSDNSRIYLINSKQEILCSTTKEGTNSNNGLSKAPSLLSINESAESILGVAVKTLFSTGDTHATFEAKGVKYVATVQKLNKLPISMMIITPQSDYTEDFERVKQAMFYISILIFIVAFVFVLFLSRRISKPIARLSEYARSIEQMNAEDTPVAIHSNILEIRDLENSMNAMRQSVLTFSKYAPKTLVRKLLVEGVQPVIGGQTAEITMMFTDIEKFSTVSEKLPAEYLMMHLSEYFDELTRKIVENNGVIDKYIGDSIMAIWGAPDPDENQVVNACNSAIECAELVEQLKVRWQPLGKPPLPTRFGIHTGQATIGNIGSSDRMNYTAIGDSVNIASRLEGANKVYGTRILVSESVESVAREQILFRVIDRVAVKGRVGGIVVYEPLCAMRNADNEDYYRFIELSSKSKEAFELYQSRRFKEALKIYEELAENFPSRESAISPVMESCRGLIKNADPEWDGVNRLSTK